MDIERAPTGARASLVDQIAELEELIAEAVVTDGDDARRINRLRIMLQRKKADLRALHTGGCR